MLHCPLNMKHPLVEIFRDVVLQYSFVMDSLKMKSMQSADGDVRRKCSHIKIHRSWVQHPPANVAK